MPPATSSAPNASADRLARLDHEPIVIKSSQTIAVVLLAGSLAFVGLGVYMVATDEDGALWVPALLMFAVGTIFALVRLARPSVMTITTEGVHVRTMLRTWSLRWDQTQPFFVYKAPVGNPASGLVVGEMAAFRWSGTPASPRPTRRFGRLSGIDGGFGSDWALSARDLVDVLNAARERSMTPPTA